MHPTFRLFALASLMLSAPLGCRSRAASNPSSHSTTATASDANEADAKIPVGSDDPTRGRRTAYVTIVLFSDLQCEPCARLAATLARVQEEYDGDSVRIVFKHQPSSLNVHAKLAATVSQGVFATKGADAFFRYQDTAFRHRESLNAESIRKWGIAAGLTAQAIDAGLERGAWADKVERDMDLAKRIGANAAPTSFVNGVAVEGTQPFEAFKDLIEVELSKARALEQSGVPRTLIYRQAVAANFVDPKMRTARVEGNEIDDPRAIWKVPVGSSPVRGKVSAPITIVAFSEFDCPLCKQAETTLDRVRAEYGDKVRIVWKDAPSHPRAMPAASLARAARAQKGDTGFWDMHDRLFAATRLDDLELETIARAAGLDVKTAMAAIKTEKGKGDIEADLALVDEVEATGTPHFFVNGRRLVGAQPYEKWKPLLDEELRRAEGLLRSGIAATGLYDWMIKDGKPGEPEQKNVPANPAAPFKGTPNAPVVIQQFADFQCPACRRLDATLDDLVKAYPGKVKIVWRDLPVPTHAEALLAAEAAREALTQDGNDAFWKMHARLLSATRLGRDDLETYGKEVGLDPAKLHKALQGRIHRPALQAEANVAFDAGIVSSPALLVGPYFLSGTPTLGALRRLVERVLVESRSPKAAGAAMPAPKLPAGSSPTPATTKFSVVDVVVGTGRAAKNGDTVVVHYTGRLADGTEFDSSRKRGQPFSFALGSGMVIRGWEMGLVGMKVGGRRKLTIPPELGYGNHGAGAAIPPKSTLFLDVELVGIQ